MLFLLMLCVSWPWFPTPTMPVPPALWGLRFCLRPLELGFRWIRLTWIDSFILLFTWCNGFWFPALSVYCMRTPSSKSLMFVSDGLSRPSSVGGSPWPAGLSLFWVVLVKLWRLWFYAVCPSAFELLLVAWLRTNGLLRSYNLIDCWTFSSSGGAYFGFAGASSSECISMPNSAKKSSKLTSFFAFK